MKSEDRHRTSDQDHEINIDSLLSLKWVYCANPMVSIPGRGSLKSTTGLEDWFLPRRTIKPALCIITYLIKCPQVPRIVIRN